MSDQPDNDFGDYKPDHRLADIYEEAERMDDSIFESLCPSYVEMSEEAGRYSDDELVGQGALKDVYRTYDNRTRRWVAMARLRKERGLQYYDLFVHEAWLISSLNHPNIIKVHDAGVDEDGRPFFTMVLKGDSTLADRIKDSEKIALTDLLEDFNKVCDALAYAHSQKILHLDLKPENIQCDRFGHVLVCDWGLGHRLDQNTEEDESDALAMHSLEGTTLAGQIKGSLGYMAPEQAIANQTLDERTDIYALGCILHTILCGEPPFKGSKEQVLVDTAASKIVPPRSRFPERNIPEGLEAVVMKATQLKPENRYQSALSLKKEIQKYQTGYATEAEQPGFYREARLFLARNRIAASVALIALVITTVLTVLYVQHLGQQQLATQEERNRANVLLSEVNVLSSEYQELSAKSKLSREQLAAQLANSVNRLKNLSIYQRPAASIEHAERMIQMALDLDPTCQNALVQRFKLKCIKLNFKEALEYIPSNPPKADLSLVALAKSFPDFEFGGENRISADELVQFYNRAYELIPPQAGYAERAFCYHINRIKDSREKAKALAALLAFYNGGPEQISVEYEHASAALVITAKKDMMLRIQGGGASNKSLLRYFAIRDLKLQVPGKFLLKDIDRLIVENLDISRCDNLVLPEKMYLSHLRRIDISPNQFSVDELQKSIRAFTDFKIFEKLLTPEQ